MARIATVSSSSSARIAANKGGLSRTSRIARHESKRFSRLTESVRVCVGSGVSMASANPPWRSGSKKARSCKLSETVSEARPDDVLELDEVWLFVHDKKQKCRLWTAMCRRTRQLAAFVIGDHSARTCTRLWAKLPATYKRCHSFSDLWVAKPSDRRRLH